MERDRQQQELDHVAAAVAGDASAFERLYRSHVARIHTLARRLLGPTRADDATQEVFFLAWRKLASYRREGPFGGWLYRLARNWMLSEVGRERRHLPALGLDEIGEPSAPPVEPGWFVDLDTALERLPSGARRVLALRHFAGCSHREIAQLLDINVGTSKSQLHRARLLMRDYLETGPVTGAEGNERGKA